MPHRTFAAPGEHEHVPGRVGDDLREVVDGAALLLPGELGGADRAAQPPVTVGIAREQEQVAALRIGHPVLRRGEPQRQLRAEDGADPELGGGLGEPDHAVHPVVVGEREGVEPQAGGPLDQLLGVARAVQEAEVGVAVQLGVRDAGALIDRGRVGGPVRLPLARPGRRVAPVCLRPARQTRARAAGERGLQLGPRHVRITPPHADDSTRTGVRAVLFRCAAPVYAGGVARLSHPESSVAQDGGPSHLAQQVRQPRPGCDGAAGVRRRGRGCDTRRGATRGGSRRQHAPLRPASPLGADAGPCRGRRPRRRSAHTSVGSPACAPSPRAPPCSGRWR